MSFGLPELLGSAPLRYITWCPISRVCAHSSLAVRLWLYLFWVCVCLGVYVSEQAVYAYLKDPSPHHR